MTSLIMNDEAKRKFVKRVGRLIGREARKAGLDPLEFNGGFFGERSSTFICSVDMSADKKELH